MNNGCRCRRQRRQCVDALYLLLFVTIAIHIVGTDIHEIKKTGNRRNEIDKGKKEKKIIRKKTYKRLHKTQ